MTEFPAQYPDWWDAMSQYYVKEWCPQWSSPVPDHVPVVTKLQNIRIMDHFIYDMERLHGCRILLTETPGANGYISTKTRIEIVDEKKFTLFLLRWL
jgi:hypothetical protein